MNIYLDVYLKNLHAFYSQSLQFIANIHQLHAIWRFNFFYYGKLSNHLLFNLLAFFYHFIYYEENA